MPYPVVTIPRATHNAMTSPRTLAMTSSSNKLTIASSGFLNFKAIPKVAQTNTEGMVKSGGER